MTSEDLNKGKGLFMLVMVLLAIPQIIFRFNHPLMSETQLFLNFFEAYIEFFNRY